MTPSGGFSRDSGATIAAPIRAALFGSCTEDEVARDEDDDRA